MGLLVSHQDHKGQRTPRAWCGAVSGALLFPPSLTTNLTLDEHEEVVHLALFSSSLLGLSLVFQLQQVLPPPSQGLRESGCLLWHTAKEGWMSNRRNRLSRRELARCSIRSGANLSVGTWGYLAGRRGLTRGPMVEISTNIAPPVNED